MKMRAVAVMVCMMACVALLGLATPEATAQGPQLMSKAGPDLVIQQIVIREEGTAEFHSARVDVRVRNIGGATAGASVTALVYSNDATGGAIVLTQETPAIDRGTYRDVEFVLEGIAGHLSGMLLAVADAPVAGSTTGQVTEGLRLVLMAPGTQRTDLNNTFGVIFSTQGRALPLRFQNPLVD